VRPSSIDVINDLDGQKIPLDKNIWRLSNSPAHILAYKNIEQPFHNSGSFDFKSKLQSRVLENHQHRLKISRKLEFDNTFDEFDQALKDERKIDPKKERAKKPISENPSKSIRRNSSQNIRKGEH
jgi:hypothetical protein